MKDSPEIGEKPGGVNFGKSGESRAQVVEAFAQKGVSVSEHSVPLLRGGQMSGSGLEERVRSAEVLYSDNASLKNAFYSQIADAGVAEITISPYSDVTHTIISDHFTEAVAESINLDSQDVRRSIRGMRVDMLLTPAPNRALVDSFVRSAEDFLVYKRLIHERFPAQDTFLRLDQAWDHETMGSFYKSLYATLGKRAIGTWTPYEMVPLSLFYKQQREGGNHLTSLDRLLLERYKNGQPLGGIVDSLRGRTNVDLDLKVLIQHRNVLIHGTPHVNTKLTTKVI